MQPDDSSRNVTSTDAECTVTEAPLEGDGCTAEAVEDFADRRVRFGPGSVEELGAAERGGEPVTPALRVKLVTEALVGPVIALAHEILAGGPRVTGRGIQLAERILAEADATFASLRTGTALLLPCSAGVSASVSPLSTEWVATCSKDEDCPFEGTAVESHDTCAPGVGVRCENLTGVAMQEHCERREGLASVVLTERLATQDNDVEWALASALRRAADASRFDVVAQLARELEARRLARAAKGHRQG